ncbi:uncharacterized protein HD556DRAFT_1224501 [Suillus plorans]|uniref:Uncharacterized protein n=1 Tax=Suillus plorans TaxID=116603 RepID=A0A9P7DZ21_9AGAM|nr:uncharacterized protein HD556DRAFT_1224501 [Suillus plorans]KAG1806772.1 hypothetical protein HD556DRAFT_1224501 [Suillus plorans]
MPTIHSSQNNHPLPLSPPETDQESLPVQLPQASLVAGAELEQLGHSALSFPERSRFQSRRTSTLPYQNSGGVRENRDRTPSRASKSLIVVLPPSDFPMDHGQLGNMLSMGPRHRISQGILMPLFPTMYGQLTAIAREFNFPSTVGLCLYHHITENGITMTPRISDDAWQYLWAHLIESRNGSQQLPIGGRVEFDIDLNKARWFDAWLAGTLRDDTVVPAPQSHASILHLRGDSKTTFAEEHIANEDRWENQTNQSNSRPTAIRQAPKKLSLVDRLDSTALQDSYKASQATSLPLNHVAHQLSPIPQSAVPQVSKAELRRRVNSWRASASLDPASMTESYQPIPDATLGAAAIQPTDEYPLEVEAGAQEPLNLADYAWSVTSAGPLSPPLDSPSSSYRLPSVHLDRRIQESVLLTPITATSWGPLDDDWLSDVSSIARLPSPDIGRRMLESAPLTPATATSWGPADDWRSDVSSVDRLPSPDIAHRILEDALASPASEGPVSEVRNVSPAEESYSPWASMSASLSSWFDVSKVATLPSTTYNPWAGMPWVQVWPWSELESAVSGLSYSPWAIVPAIRAWPWFDIHASKDNGDLELQRGLKSEYPSLDIYPASYPYFDIYPACEVNSSLSSARGYPILEIYPAVYPHFNLYPSIACSVITSAEKTAASQPKKSVIVELAPVYPLFNLYPPLYPYNLSSIYPAPAVELFSSVVLPSSYPWLIIYPPVYPHVNPYPQVSAEVAGPRRAKDEIAQPVQVKLGPRYPVFDIYPHVYPHFNLYPARAAEPASWEEDITNNELFVSSNMYPFLVIYPAVYPHFDLYPARAAELASREEETTSDKCSVLEYPFLVIYPAVYPHFDLYPARAAELASREADITNSKPSVSSSTYPFLVIYPSVYPYFDLYPGILSRVDAPAASGKSTVRMDHGYPVLNIYPAVYPHLDIYPALGKVAQPSQKVTNMSVRPLSAKRRRKAHAELHTEVAQSPGFLVARRKSAKTHHQLHVEVFVNGVTWTPSGYVQDLALPDRPHEDSNRSSRHRMHSVHEIIPRLSHSRSVSLSNQESPTNPSLRERQQHVLHNAPPIPPLRISSPGVPAVSEFPIPVSPPPSPPSRLSQAVRSFRSSIMQGRNLTSTSDNHNERAKSPTRSMFTSFDRRSSMIPPLSPHDPSDRLGRSRVQQGLVLQRARAYEQSTCMSFSFYVRLESNLTIEFKASSRHHSQSVKDTLPSLLPIPDFPHAIDLSLKADMDRSSLLKNATPSTSS